MRQLISGTTLRGQAIFGNEFYIFSILRDIEVPHLEKLKYYKRFVEKAYICLAEGISDLNNSCRVAQ